MKNESQKFEKDIARIHALIEGSGAEVTWNAKVIDPSSKKNKRKRQIDVLIKRGDWRTFVECRLHKGKQNVKWIEELIGRKASLNADCIVGVAANGFTKGAIEKASDFGIILREMKELKEEEVLAWTKTINASLCFQSYSDYDISLYLYPGQSGFIYPDKFARELQEHKHFYSIAHAPCNGINEKFRKDKEKGPFKFKAKLEFDGDLTITDLNIKEAVITGIATIVQRRLDFPLLMGYGEPSSKEKIREAFIQKYKLGQTKIVYNKEAISILLDISDMDLPEYSIFSSIECSLNPDMEKGQFEIHNLEKGLMRFKDLPIRIATAPAE